MGSIINNFNSQSRVREWDQDEGSNEDLISLLPPELVTRIFSLLDLSSLGVVFRVCKQWQNLASDPRPWNIAIYDKLAIGHAKWVKWFGENVIEYKGRKEEILSLPTEGLAEEYRKFQRAFPEKNARESLMLVRFPKTLNGELTLNKLGELAKEYFPKTSAGYRSIWPPVVDQLGDESTDRSHWVLMTADVLDGSRNRAYRLQKYIVEDLSNKDLSGYEIPEILEAAVCIFAQYFDSGKRVFSDKPWTFTRCKQNVDNKQICVGGFDQVGLGVNFIGYFDESIGVAALKKL